MATIVTRASKLAALTVEELDSNFTNLNTDKIESANPTITGTLNADNIVASGDISGDLKGYGEAMLTTSPATGAISLDLSAANIFRLDLTGNVTVTFTNPPAAGSTSVATIIAIQDASGGHGITWTDGAYAGGTPPPASTGSNEVDIWTVFTYDQGTSYVVSLSMKDVS